MQKNNFPPKSLVNLLDFFISYHFYVSHTHNLSKISISDFPLSDKLYSTLGGICGYSFRIIKPSFPILSKILQVFYVRWFIYIFLIHCI